MRLLMAGLFFFVGLRQMNRVVARDFAFFVRHPPESMYRDGHDNNWLLVEFALGIPLAIGYKSEWSARALALTLFMVGGELPFSHQRECVDYAFQSPNPLTPRELKANHGF